MYSESEAYLVYLILFSYLALLDNTLEIKNKALNTYDFSNNDKACNALPLNSLVDVSSILTLIYLVVSESDHLETPSRKPSQLAQSCTRHRTSVT